MKYLLYVFLVVLLFVLCTLLPSEPVCVDCTKITWLGYEKPASPSELDAYYDSTTGLSWLYKEGKWDTLAYSTSYNPDKFYRLPLNWQGYCKPSDPLYLDAYFDTTTDISWIYNGTSWDTLARSGTDGISIIWLGQKPSHPTNPKLNQAYHNTTDSISYIYNGKDWDILAQRGSQGPQGDDVTGKNGTDGISINWLGQKSGHPSSPQMNDAYHDTTDSTSYIWNGSAWDILAQKGAQGGRYYSSTIVVPDDIASINDAIDSLPVNGGTVYIRSGEYLLTETIHINRSDVNIIGEPGTILKLDSHINQPVIIIGANSIPPQPDIFVSNIKLSDLELDGQMGVQDSEYHSSGSGIRNNCIDVNMVTNLRISNVDVHDGRSGGLVVSWNSSMIFVENSVFHHNFFDGIALYDSRDIYISNFSCNDNNNAGLSFDNNLKNVTLSNGIMRQNGDVGIFIRHSTDISFTSIQIMNSGNHGAFLGHSEDEITHDPILNTGVTRIFFTSCSFIANSGYGIYYGTNSQMSSENAVKACLFSGNLKGPFYDLQNDIIKTDFPVANAGNDTTGFTSIPIQLDGSGSYSSSGDSVTYMWKNINGGNIDNPASKNPLFSSDSSGEFVISLNVYSNTLESPPDIVKITIVDTTLPVVLIADPGKDTSGFISVPIQLNGSKSYSSAGGTIDYLWKSLNGGTLQNITQETPVFIADMVGEYVLSLNVTQGTIEGDLAYINIVISDTSTPPENQLPVAMAGFQGSGYYVIQDTITLDGSGSSDPEGSPLTYNWICAETNPEIVLLDNTPTPSFVGTTPGVYLFLLYVNDGELSSLVDQTIVEVIKPKFYVTKASVSGAFNKIQDALNSVQPGDTVVIAPGTYPETPKVQTSNIYLIGLDRESVIIDGQGDSSTLTIDEFVSSVTVKNLTVTKGGRSDPLQDIDVGGILCYYANTIIIENVNARYNFGDGIRLYQSQDITIRDTYIGYNNFNGIKTSSSSFTLINSVIESNGVKDHSGTWGIILLNNDNKEYTVTISNSQFLNATHLQIWIDGPFAVTLSDSHFENIHNGIDCNPIHNCSTNLISYTVNNVTGVINSCSF